MLEVVGGISRHAQALHDPLRDNVLHGGHRHDLVPAQRSERVLQRAARAFGRVAISPVLGRKTPANFARRREVRFKRYLAQTDDAGTWEVSCLTERTFIRSARGGS